MNQPIDNQKQNFTQQLMQLGLSGNTANSQGLGKAFGTGKAANGIDLGSFKEAKDLLKNQFQNLLKQAIDQKKSAQQSAKADHLDSVQSRNSNRQEIKNTRKEARAEEKDDRISNRQNDNKHCDEDKKCGTTASKEEPQATTGEASASDQNSTAGVNTTQTGETNSDTAGSNNNTEESSITETTAVTETASTEETPSLVAMLASQNSANIKINPTNTSEQNQADETSSTQAIGEETAQNTDLLLGAPQTELSEEGTQQSTQKQGKIDLSELDMTQVQGEGSFEALVNQLADELDTKTTEELQELLKSVMESGSSAPDSPELTLDTKLLAQGGAETNSNPAIGSTSQDDGPSNVVIQAMAQNTQGDTSDGNESQNFSDAEGSFSIESISGDMATGTSSAEGANSFDDILSSIRTEGISSSSSAKVGQKTNTPFSIEGLDTTDQIAAGASYTMKAGRKEVIIQLNPDNLGQVKVHLSSGANQSISARLIADSSETKELLQNQMQQLRESLEKQGLTVEKIAISYTEPSEQASDTANQQQHSGWDQQNWQHRQSQHQQDHQQHPQNNQAFDFSQFNNQFNNPPSGQGQNHSETQNPNHTNRDQAHFDTEHNRAPEHARRDEAHEGRVSVLA